VEQSCLAISRPRLGIAATVVLALFCGSLTLSCLQSSTVQSNSTAGPTLSAKLTPFAFYEEGRALFIAVDTRATDLTKKGTVFPLGLALANTLAPAKTFTSESFILETDDGQRFPLVSHAEFRRDYKRSTTDERLAADFDESLRTRFRTYNRIGWTLFPAAGAATRQAALELNRGFWTRNYLYFPIPEGGLQGREFTLLVSVPEVEETLIVRFSVK